MKKLLLSSAVMFFLCSMSFAQQQKQTSAAKENKKSLLTPIPTQQTALDQKKVHSTSPMEESKMEAPKTKKASERPSIFIILGADQQASNEKLLKSKVKGTNNNL